MSSPLRELCTLIADVGLANASKLALQFNQLLANASEASLDEDAHQVILLSFAFVNWAFANGVWSDLENVKLRRDLMTESRNVMILELARRQSPSREAPDVAFLAMQIDFDEFQPFATAYLERMKLLDESGMTMDANGALFFALEWIQQRLRIADRIMDNIVPAFLAEVGDFAEVETIAAQVNRAAITRSPNR
jgi:hypothetical protein